jgi:ankyrin repeat protein
LADEIDPLTLLARDGTEEEVRARAAKGLPPDGGAEALWMAAAWLRPAVVRILLDAGVFAGAAKHHGATALAAAFQRGFTRDGCEIAEVLLSRGADINHADAIGWTALHHAAWCAQPAIVAFLLERGARSDLIDREGKTALDLAHGRTYNDYRDMSDSSNPPEADYLAVERLLRES